MTESDVMNEAFLYANLEHLATLDPSPVSPIFPPLPNGFGLLPDDFAPNAASVVLQVNAIEDVSLPFAHRLRAIAPPTSDGASEAGRTAQTDPHEEADLDSALRAMEGDVYGGQAASPRRGRRRRLLKFTLTDGFTRVAALEECQVGCEALRHGVSFGAKLRLATPLTLRHGVIVLTTEGTTLLGGFVPELQLFWERYAAGALEGLTGRPKRVQMETERNAEDAMRTGTEMFVGAEERPAPSFQLQQPSPNLQQQHQLQQSLPNLQQQHQHQQSLSNPLQQQMLGSALSRPPQTRVTPFVSNALLAQRFPPPAPISAWAAHRPMTAPFTTVAVIAEVTSELTIREAPQPLYSLFVMLTSPPAIGADRVDGNANEEAEDGLVVDLGHQWLRRALGMDPHAFRTLSLSQAPHDVTRLGALVERIGSELENFGEAVFVLRLREEDGVVEVMESQLRQS